MNEAVKKQLKEPILFVGAIVVCLVLVSLLVFYKSSSFPIVLQAKASGNDRDPGKNFAQQLPISHGAAPDYKEGLPIVDSDLKPIFPSAVAVCGQDLFFLDPFGLWISKSEVRQILHPHRLVCRRLVPPGGKIDGVPVQELSSFAYYPRRRILVLLDKAGDLFEFSTVDETWHVLRANRPITGSPDPEFVDLGLMNETIILLDPERNQIWKLPMNDGKVSCFFGQCLPWQLKPGMPNVSRGVSLAYSSYCYVLDADGIITKYSVSENDLKAVRQPFFWKRPKNMRPSRIIASSDGMLYIIERENNRVLVVHSSDGQLSQFVFPACSDLRGLIPGKEGFWIISGSSLIFKNFSHADPPGATLHPRRIDHRLDGLILPISGIKLPRHPGVWPGARRLYRYGVHKGMDFFQDAGVTTRVMMGTPVRAVDGGKVLRADTRFVDMNSVTLSKVMRQCLKEHKTSELNEDLFRGCQIWVDHGGGLITRYAHLNGIKSGIRVGDYVSGGDTIGYVGVSGTGQNLPGRVKHPHLHFEIWLDGQYLGWGLMPSETIGVFEDVFGKAEVR